MIGMDNLLRVAMEMVAAIGSRRRVEATSPRPFVVIDDKGEEDHGLKLQEVRVEGAYFSVGAFIFA